MWAMVAKEFRQLRRDRRTLALLVMQPLLLLVVFGYAASFDVDEITTAVIGPDADTVADALPERFTVTHQDFDGGPGDAEELLRDGDVAVAVVAGSSPTVLIDGSSLFAARSALTELASAGDAGGARPEVEILFNPDLETSTVMVPALIGFVLLFVGTVATSLGVVRERQAGTLEQLAIMPFRPRDVLGGKLLPYLAVSLLDLALVVAAGLILFDVPFEGSPWLFGGGAVLFLAVTLGTGILISSVSENQGQAIQLAILTLLPQILLSGMLFPLESMAAGVRWIAWLLPLTYFVEISQGVLLRGAGLEAVAFPLGMLAVIGTVVFALAVLRFRRELGTS